MRGEELAPALEGILETALYADDLDRAEAFYGTVLGLERITRAGNRHVFFRCGDGVLLIFNPAETVKPPADGALPVPPHGTKGNGHMCFRVGRQALDACHDRGGHPLAEQRQLLLLPRSGRKQPRMRGAGPLGQGLNYGDKLERMRKKCARFSARILL
jgi:catechol 2,3-dioxygenase-like lactoylglutathione lyase family enzyme